MANPNITTRPDPRGSGPKTESPRERAARRAEELRSHAGTMDEGTDKFAAPPPPDGWTYEWKRKTLFGQEDPAYQVNLMRAGWEPVPVSRHPEMMPQQGSWQTIERDGMILMERPTEIVDEARSIELRNARNQVRAKEAQLNGAPDGHFERNNKGAPMAKVHKGYKAIPIPEE